MKKIVVFGVVIFVLAALSPGLIRGEEEAATPESLHRKAYLLSRDAQRAAYREDLMEAYQNYLEAVRIYREIARLDPQWRPDSVQTRIAGWQEAADTIGRKIFTLPDGVVEIAPGMTREGKRYDDGRSLTGKIKTAGDDEYEVDSFTVTVVREGPLAGASCTCPDFTYRGSKHNFACKHIWAVITKENLLR
ncbi:MAG: SWIM zinc finger family protein [Candidatus Erginobacter occultus]|nr:SWIM zinc finger family protein [Candidatus Erginobacter occultus]